MTRYYKIFSALRFQQLNLKNGAVLTTDFPPLYSCDSPNWLARWHAALAHTKIYPALDIIFTEVEPHGNIITTDNGDGRETTSDELRIIRKIPKSQFAQMQLIELQTGKYNENVVYFNYLQSLNMELSGVHLPQEFVIINNIESIVANSFYNTVIEGNLSIADSKIKKVTPGMFRKIYIKGNLILPDETIITNGAMRYAKIKGQIYSATEALRHNLHIR